MTQEQDINNYTDDGILVQHILDDLRTNILSTGAEYDSSSLSDIIRKRYPGATPAIIKSVIDTIFNDPGVKSQVAGTFPGFKLLISARNPNLGFGKPSQPATLNNQTTTNQSPQQPTNQQTNNVKVPPAIQARIDALSDSDKTQLQQTAVSVVSDILPQIQQPIDSTELQNQIVTKYNISSDLASLLVDILLLYPEYQAKIKATNQPNQQQLQQQQSLGQQHPPNNDGVYSNAKTKPTSTQQQQRPTTADLPPTTQQQQRPTTADLPPTTQQQTDQQQSQQGGTDQTDASLGKQPFFKYKHMNHLSGSPRANFE